MPVGDLRLTVPAASYFAVDDRLNPTGELAVLETPFDLRDGSLVTELDLDTAFGGLNTKDRVSAVLAAPDGSTPRCFRTTTGSTCRCSRRALPGRRWSQAAIAIEPMTAPPDALNSGLGLRWLEPGELWEGSWGLRYAGGATR